uniref:Uncharacterized protein n=1 Tax=Euplotes harpa TaxID=151035 RepID=A0A7S3J6G9_9SPIT|mmetsp:Transcript_1987/g.2502  ORF Transcript_1987/g.2502 Transcript_1987/m.2502 type:complete len:172 (+) Transcript_1987:120-635(+)
MRSTRLHLRSWVGLFLFFLFLSMVVSVVSLIVQIVLNRKSLPIFDKYPEPENPDEKLLKEWTEGKPPKLKKQKTPPVAEKIEDPPKKDVEESTVQDNTINESSVYSDDSESESASASETSRSEPENVDDYANSRRIPQAEVNLMETGFSTGMSQLREAQIQEYRQKEKQKF